MKLKISLLTACCVVLAAQVFATPWVVPDQILVKPKPGQAQEQVRHLFAQHGAQQVGEIAQIDVRILRVPEERQAQVLEALSHNPNIEFAEPDRIVPPDLTPNDTYYANSWQLPTLQAPAAWDITTGRSDVIIAILDTGVNGAHPDLAANMVAGWNFYDNNADTSDVYGHGTAVAGSAAAVGNNGVGIAGLAWNCKIMPIRISDLNGYAWTSTAANALTWAADHGARVANISFAMWNSATVQTAASYMQSKKGVVTISAGNDGATYTYANSPTVLTVSATDSNDLLASWSARGTPIDLAAPGVSVTVTTSSGGYGYGSGTSFAAPIVAGVAALVISANPDLTAAEIQGALTQSADDLGAAGWDSSYGWGRVNAYQAVLAATAAEPPLPPSPPPDTTNPTTEVTSPSTGATVSGVVQVTATASDSGGVAQIELYTDGVLSGSSAGASLSYAWDTTQVSNGSHTLRSKAYDNSGNAAESQTVTVTVANAVPDLTPPTVAITSPADGSRAVKTVKVSVSASDNVGVTQVRLFVDGALLFTDNTAPYTFSWNPSKAAKGPHTLQATASDAAGNSAASGIVTVYK